MEPYASLEVGAVIVDEGKVVRPSQPIASVRSCFVTFRGCRFELMWQPGRHENQREGGEAGVAHVAMSAGSRVRVHALIAALRKSGVPVVGEPRLTGDGYYEAVIEDPEGNRIEIVG